MAEQMMEQKYNILQEKLLHIDAKYTALGAAE